MTKRRRFTADFKAKVALEALRGDKPMQEIAGRHKVHPNQVRTWKRQAMEGLGAIFSNASDKAEKDREAELHDLHAKIGQLTVERDAARAYAAPLAPRSCSMAGGLER